MEARNYKYGHLTIELLELLTDKPLTIADGFGTSDCAVRLRQMINAYGDIAGKAYAEACSIKYKKES